MEDAFKFISSILMIIVSILLIIGLLSGVDLSTYSVEYECVDVLVVSADHIPRQTRLISTGQTVIPVVLSERYYVIVDYDGKQYEFDGEDLYMSYCRFIGSYVEATLEKKIYSDGNITSEVVLLGFDESECEE